MAIIFNKKLIFGSPPESKVIIFDETNSHYIEEYILNNISSFIYKMRPENIYINSRIILCFLRRLTDIILKIFKEKNNKLGLSLLELLHYYRMATIEIINPNVIITYIDNSDDYHHLCRDFKNAQFFAIQNGNHSNREFEIKNKKFYLQHYFCFGDYEKDRFLKFGQVVQDYYPVGSLPFGIYRYHNNQNFKIKYDIGIVSCFRIKSKMRDSQKDFFISLDVMHSFLARYIDEHNLRAGFFMRYPFDNQEEIQYYKKIYGNNVDYVGNIKGKSTYQGIDMSEIIVSSLSTTICEAMGYGKKILFCDFTKTDKYHDYDSMIMFTDNNYISFKKRLDGLRCEAYESYRNRTKQYASYLMKFNPDYPPHMYIRDKLKGYL